MADTDVLTERIRSRLAGREELTEDRVFDGVGFFIDGRMAVAVLGDSICIHLDDGPGPASEGVTEPFTFAGRPIPGWVSISSERLDDAALSYWVDRGVSNVDSPM